MKLLDRLTDFLIAREPGRALQVAIDRTAESVVRDMVDDVVDDTGITPTEDQIDNATAQVADRMADAAWEDSTTGYMVLCRIVELERYDPDDHAPDCDSQIDGRESDCTCKDRRTRVYLGSPDEQEDD